MRSTGHRKRMSSAQMQSQLPLLATKNLGLIASNASQAKYLLSKTTWEDSFLPLANVVVLSDHSSWRWCAEPHPGRLCLDGGAS